MNLVPRIKNKLKRIKEKVRKKLMKKQLFLIYSMGKVGSLTIVHIFKKQHPDYPLSHVHFLSDYWVKERLPSLHKEWNPMIDWAKRTYKLIEDHPKHRIKVITLVREPMSRDISDIFQNWKGIFNTNSLDSISYDKMKDFLDNHQHRFVLNWFDTDFQPYLGFDIYSQPFNIETGYSIYKTEKADILVLRMDKMNDCLVGAIKKFCGLQIKITEATNTSKDKEGKELYLELMQNYKPSKEKLQILYNSKFVNHFFTKKETNTFIEKWSRGEWNLKTLNQ